MPTLQDRFAPRRNSFDLLRLSFALIVVCSHGMELHNGHQPRIGLAAPGTFALDGFFMLSGFLVTRSWFGLGSLPRFAWHRFLRIMPGFWVCLLVIAFVVAPLAAILRGMSPTVAFTGDPSAWKFVLVNSALLIAQYDIAGILADNPHPNSFDGSLWTLVFEAFCYTLVGALGVTGLLRRKPVVVLAVVAVLLLLTAMQEAGLPVLMNDRVLRLVLVFLVGSIAYLYADRIPMHWGIAAGCAALFALSLALFDDYRALGAVPLAYLLFWSAVSFPWPCTVRADLSYGMYIYHWPVLQLLVLTAANDLPTAAFIALAAVITAVPAAMSWYLIERPALGRKDSALPDRVARRVVGTPGRHRAGSRPHELRTEEIRTDKLPVQRVRGPQEFRTPLPDDQRTDELPVVQIWIPSQVQRPEPASSHRPPARST